MQPPVKNIASILQLTFLGEKHFLQANEGKVITFIIGNNYYHVIYRIRDSIPRNEFSRFLVVSTSTTSTSYKSLAVLCVRSTFSIFLSWSSQNSSTKRRNPFG